VQSDVNAFPPIGPTFLSERPKNTAIPWDLDDREAGGIVKAFCLDDGPAEG
jgi:hypothetical protein